MVADTASDDTALLQTAVRLTRATRLHPRFRKGASVRGAVATVAIAERLGRGRRRLRGREPRMLRRAAEPDSPPAWTCATTSTPTSGRRSTTPGLVVDAVKTPTSRSRRRTPRKA